MLSTFWKHRRHLWRYRVVYFGPATSSLAALTQSRRLDQLFAKYEVWLGARDTSVVDVAHAADVWAIEVEQVAASDPESSVISKHGVILKSLAASARQFEQASTRLAVEERRFAATEAARSEMEVAFLRMALGLRELMTAIVASLPRDDLI